MSVKTGVTTIPQVEITLLRDMHICITFKPTFQGYNVFVQRLRIDQPSVTNWPTLGARLRSDQH